MFKIKCDFIQESVITAMCPLSYDLRAICESSRGWDSSIWCSIYKYRNVLIHVIPFRRIANKNIKAYQKYKPQNMLNSVIISLLHKK